MMTNVPIITLLPILFLAMAASFFLTKALTKRLVQKAIMDIPNDRSMHTTPVPRGGGLAVVGIILIGLLSFSFATNGGIFMYPLLSLTLLLSVSWIDDKRNISPFVRLAAHLLAAFIGSFAFSESALFGNVLPFWLDRILLIVGWAWFMNLYNFMDGIDGITSIESICCAVGVSILFYMTNHHSFSSLLLPTLITGSCAGFLFLNWHPAKIFLGDVGSVPLGFLMGFLLIQLALSDFLAPALLIPLYYLADSGITIFKRALRKEKIWQAHREHYYQRATGAIGSPVPVVLSILAGNIGLIFSAALTLYYPWLGVIVGVVILIVLLAHLKLWGQQTKLSR